jgi:hypothetical protein
MVHAATADSPDHGPSSFRARQSVRHFWCSTLILSKYSISGKEWSQEGGKVRRCRASGWGDVGNWVLGQIGSGDVGKNGARHTDMRTTENKGQEN